MFLQITLIYLSQSSHSVPPEKNEHNMNSGFGAQTACLSSSSTPAVSLASSELLLLFSVLLLSCLFLIFELRVRCGLWTEITWKCKESKPLKTRWSSMRVQSPRKSIIFNNWRETITDLRKNTVKYVLKIEELSHFFYRIHGSSDTRLMREFYLACKVLTAWLWPAHARGAVHMYVVQCTCRYIIA